MAFEEQFTLKIGAGPQVSVNLHFRNDNTVQLNVTSGSDSALATWTIDVAHKSLKLDMTAAVGTTVACLLKSGTIQEIEKCLKEKAAGALADATFCIAGCLHIM